MTFHRRGRGTPKEEKTAVRNTWLSVRTRPSSHPTRNKGEGIRHHGVKTRTKAFVSCKKKTFHFFFVCLAAPLDCRLLTRIVVWDAHTAPAHFWPQALALGTEGLRRQSRGCVPIPRTLIYMTRSTLPSPPFYTHKYASASIHQMICKAIPDCTRSRRPDPPI